VSARNGCASRNACSGPTAGRFGRPRGRQEAHRSMPSSSNSRRNWSSTTSASAPTTSSDGSRVRRFGRQSAPERGEAGVLALREGRLDAAAGIVQDRARAAKSRDSRAARDEVELDHLGRAGADEEQQLDVGPALEQPVTTRSSSALASASPGEIALVDDRGGEARLGEDHHAGGRLDEMRAGARADDQEEGVLDLAVQPDDAGQPAEHLALAALVSTVNRSKDTLNRRPGRLVAATTLLRCVKWH
jgi:hypothetical protein